MKGMDPRLLLQWLMDRAKDNSSSLAAKLNNSPSQPQIHKFLSGKAKQPRHSTLAPIAKHYGIPIESLYDEDVAEHLMEQLNYPDPPSSAVIDPNSKANQPERLINSAQAATDNVATLVGALTALQTLLQQADSLDRAACKPIIAAMLDDPDRGDLVQRIINILEPPTAKQHEPETGARRRIV